VWRVRELRGKDMPKRKKERIGARNKIASTWSM
jgi:hypothetical protein